MSPFTPCFSEFDSEDDNKDGEHDETEDSQDNDAVTAVTDIENSGLVTWWDSGRFLNTLQVLEKSQSMQKGL